MGELEVPSALLRRLALPVRLALPQTNSLQLTALGKNRLVSRVMVLDDAENKAEMLAKKISTLGIKADHIEIKDRHTLEETVTQVMAGNYDLVIIDYGMKLFNGAQLTKALRKAGFRRLIIINSKELATKKESGETTALQEVVEAGADGILPVKDDLVSLFGEIIRYSTRQIKKQ